MNKITKKKKTIIFNTKKFAARIYPWNLELEEYKLTSFAPNT
jgi:hypothetical protein